MKKSINQETYLFLFHYSGVGASIYKNCQDYILQPIKALPIQLPGREELIDEVPYDDMNLLVKYLALKLQQYTHNSIIFFGHCLGALIAYETALALLKLSKVNIKHFFVSAAPAPHRHHTTTSVHHLPSKEFLEKIQQRSYFKEALPANSMCKILLSGLRADFKLYETYTRVNPTVLPCPITIMRGRQDDFIEEQQLISWKDITQDKFHIKTFPGNHLYLHKQMKSIIRTIETQLTTHDMIDAC